MWAKSTLGLLAAILVVGIWSNASGQGGNLTCPTRSPGTHDNSCASTAFVAASPVGLHAANPSAQVGPVVINGSAVTYMRSDAAPKLSDTAVAPGTYGDSTHVSAITVDQQGRLTSATPVAFTPLSAISDGQVLANTSGGSAIPIGTNASTWFDKAYCNTIGYVLVRFTSLWTCAQGMPANVEWFGASTAGSAASNVIAIQATVNALTKGGIVLFPNAGYNVNAVISTNGVPITFKCANYADTSTGNINATTTTDNIFHLNANLSSVDGCYLNRTGTPTTGKGIVVGSDGVAATCAITNGAGTLTCTTPVFTSGMVTRGTRVKVIGAAAAGASLFATITGFTSTTVVTVSPVAGTTVAAAVSLVADVYTDVSVRNTQVVNSNIGIHFINAARFHVTDSYFYSTGTGCNGAQIENQVSPDYGDSFWTASQAQCTDTTTGYAMQYNSSGGLKIANSKFLQGKYSLYMNWNVGVSGQLQVINSSFETCGTSAIFITQAAQFNGLTFSENEITCGSPNIVFDNSATSVVNGATVTGNQCNGGGGTCVDLGKVQYATVVGNLSNSGGGNPGINVRSNATQAYVAHNNLVGTTKTIANASTTATIVDQNGMTTANLPTAGANGSQIFVTDGAPASTPCTGTSTGSMAFRQNGAWKCF